MASLFEDKAQSDAGPVRPHLPRSGQPVPSGTCVCA